MSDVMPKLLPPMTASMMYPACEMDEKARKRLRCCCRMAKRLATVMLSTMTIQSRVCHSSTIGAKTFISTVISAKAAAAFETTDR